MTICHTQTVSLQSHVVFINSSILYIFQQIVEEFRNIFGPELKAVTGNPEGIEAVLQKVNTLMLDIETVRFDPFNPGQRYNWSGKMNRFQQEVKLIEEEANQFIDDSFRTLRSAEGAFEMMQNFKHIRSRDAINATMMRQLSEILSTFRKEVDSINDMFEVHTVHTVRTKTQRHMYMYIYMYMYMYCTCICTVHVYTFKPKCTVYTYMYMYRCIYVHACTSQ